MTYIIIGHTETSNGYDRFRNLVVEAGKFETIFFRDDERANFIYTWAYAHVYEKYEDLVIIIDGIPSDGMTDEEYKKYQILEDEMYIKMTELKEKKVADEAAKREADAKTAQEKARLLAAQTLKRDLEQLEALKKKLGLD